MILSKLCLKWFLFINDTFRRDFSIRLFLLEFPLSSIAGILVATDSNSKQKYELMELLLPDKIVNTDQVSLY